MPSSPLALLKTPREDTIDSLLGFVERSNLHDADQDSCMKACRKSSPLCKLQRGMTAKRCAGECSVACTRRSELLHEIHSFLSMHLGHEHRRILSDDARTSSFSSYGQGRRLRSLLEADESGASHHAADAHRSRLFNDEALGAMPYGMHPGELQNVWRSMEAGSLAESLEAVSFASAPHVMHTLPADGGSGRRLRRRSATATAMTHRARRLGVFTLINIVLGRDTRHKRSFGNTFIGANMELTLRN